VKKALSAVFAAPPNETWSLVFDVSGALGESIRWEALQDPQPAHVALRLSPRLCRIAAESASPPLARRALPTPLRMSAFLSAAKVSALSEFQNLVEAVGEARAQGVDIQLTIYVAEREVLADDLTDRFYVERKVLPDSTLSIELELTRTKPHLLHFFCHGTSEPSQWLEFATVQDHLAKTDGSVLLNIDRLTDCRVLETTWAVVFNCCDGGRPTSGLNSMAFRAVAQGGAPAAIGMGAPIPAAAAAIFAKSFYQGLLSQIAALNANPGTDPAELDFGEATAQARMQMHAALRASETGCTAWSLPIIYLHRDPLIIEKALDALNKEAEARLRTITGHLKALGPETPQELRQLIWNMFDSEPVVPNAFRPDLMGDFPQTPA